nr:VOC family protein [Pseudomonadota bacterium]
MPQRLSLTALVVDEYDDAIAFYVGKLGFDLREDAPLEAGKRWVVVGPRGGGGALLLARAIGD